MPTVNNNSAMQSRMMPRRTIRFWLNCLVIACILPAAAVATTMIVRSFNQERASLERDTIGTARALSQAVDAELTGVRAALLVLAASPDLAAGDLARFYDEAQRIVPVLNIDNIVLSDLSGQQLVNSLQPYGAPLPYHGDRDQLRRVIETGQPVISDLFTGRVTGKPIIVIEAPVLVDGKPRYTLAAGIFPERLSTILRRQKMPPNWVAAIVDSSETIVARTVGGDEFIGKKVSRDLERALTAAGEGVFEGTTLEGLAVFTGFSRSRFSGWAVAIGIPKAGLFGFLWEALVENIVAAVVLLVAGILLARAISARIARSIQALREPAVGLGLPGPFTVPSVSIQEAHDLGQSLVAAHQLIEQRTAERNNLRRRIMSAQEQERVRLARDIHDQTGQSFTAAILELKAIEPFVQEEGRGRLRLLRKQLDAIGQLLHRIAWELRPPSIDELGLASAVQNYLEEWGKKHAITVDFQNVDAKLDERSDEIRTTIYRVIQEALTNVAKHAADATHVGIVIGTSDDTLYLTIEDNGQGFNPAVPTSRLGLAGMRERLMLVGGHLEIESSTVGTTIFARIPLFSERAAA